MGNHYPESSYKPAPLGGEGATQEERRAALEGIAGTIQNIRYGIYTVTPDQRYGLDIRIEKPAIDKPTEGPNPVNP